MTPIAPGAAATRVKAGLVRALCRQKTAFHHLSWADDPSAVSIPDRTANVRPRALKPTDNEPLVARVRILIVDDEPLSRDRVRAFLRREPSVEIAGECADGVEALSAIRSLEPDIVFLDVRMPGRDGLQLLANLPPDRRPAVVLMTAHECFATDAFAVRVVDFLLKPFDRERFHLALTHAIHHINSRREHDLETRFASRLAAMSSPKPDRLAIKVDGRLIFLRPEEIVWVEAANNYSILHLLDAKRLILRETLSSLEKRLGGANFARVNRSALAHTSYVRELQPAKYGDYTVVLEDGTRLSLSRNLRGRLKKLLPGVR